MRVVPRQRQLRIQFFQLRLEAWQAQAEAIGTTDADVSALADLTDAARSALAEQQAARQAMRAATLRLRNAMAAMSTQGAGILMQIRARAANAGPGVYSLAKVPPPADGSPMEPPGKPYRFTVALTGLGMLTLGWDCRNPRGSRGTMYEVRRRLGPDGEFVFLGTTGRKRFVDDTLPPGSSRIIYRVRALRSTGAGEVADHIVNVGTSGLHPAMRPSGQMAA